MWLNARFDICLSLDSHDGTNNSQKCHLHLPVLGRVQLIPSHFLPGAASVLCRRATVDSSRPPASNVRPLIGQSRFPAAMATVLAVSWTVYYCVRMCKIQTDGATQTRYLCWFVSETMFHDLLLLALLMNWPEWVVSGSLSIPQTVHC